MNALYHRDRPNESRLRYLSYLPNQVSAAESCLRLQNRASHRTRQVTQPVCGSLRAEVSSVCETDRALSVDERVARNGIITV